jgi:hypothetical protein
MMVVSLAVVVNAGDDVAGTVSGTIVVNGNEVELPYVYAIELGEGFYDPADPAWKLVFVSQPVAERDLDGTLWDVSYLELLITETAEFDDEPKLQVYGQNLSMPELGSGNVSGGTYPELELKSAGPERLAGRVYHTETRELFDDTFTYDLSFDVRLSDPNAPIGELLPEGGGEPGAAYLAWVAAVHSDDLDRLRAIVPPEMAEQLADPAAAEEIEFLRLMTPTEVTILGGSSDGQTALLQVEGTMDGERLTGEIELQKMGDRWLPTSSSW